MKALLILFIALALAGCETIQNEDGTTTTRFDQKAAAGILDSGLRVYDRYNQTRYIIGYRPDGSPIYATQ